MYHRSGCGFSPLEGPVTLCLRSARNKGICCCGAQAASRVGEATICMQWGSRCGCCHAHHLHRCCPGCPEGALPALRMQGCPAAPPAPCHHTTLVQPHTHASAVGSLSMSATGAPAALIHQGAAPLRPACLWDATPLWNLASLSPPASASFGTPAPSRTCQRSSLRTGVVRAPAGSPPTAAGRQGKAAPQVVSSGGSMPLVPTTLPPRSGKVALPGRGLTLPADPTSTG